MNLSWAPSFVLYLFGVWMLFFMLKKQFIKKRDYNSDDWKILLEKEHATQFVRSKDLPHELLIKVDSKAFPTVTHEACDIVYHKLIHQLDKPMVHLKDYSNLDLKRLYGPQIIEQVSGYERNYFEFMDILFKYGKILYDNHYIKEAQDVLEQGILYHCDLSKCYLLLLQIYKEQQDEEALSRLKNVVEAEMKNSPFLHKVLKEF